MIINLYTAFEVSKFLKISKALAYRLMAQGEIPAVRFGRTVRVREEDLLAFIQNNMTKSLVQSGNGLEAYEPKPIVGECNSRPKGGSHD